MINLPEGCLWPDYQNCGINLMSSIFANFGLQPNHSTLPVLDGILKRQYRNIVLLLLDGLSISALEEHLPESSFLRTHNQHVLSAVYPSTTTAATTSIRTGLSPVEHGWLGWTMYFPQIDESVDVFPNTRQHQREQAREYHCAEEYFPVTFANQRLNKENEGTAFFVSRFDEVQADSLPRIGHAVQQICMKPGRHFVYAYWGEPDATMHNAGCQGMEASLVTKELNLQVQRIAESLPDSTLFMVTADHGLVDSQPIFFHDYPELSNMLLRPPVVEPRAAALFVKPCYKTIFTKAFQKAFGDDFLLIESRQAIASGLFGPGNPHPRIMDTLGDYLALAVSNKALFMKREHCNLLGMHAGMLKREMLVPLILAKE